MKNMQRSAARGIAAFAAALIFSAPALRAAVHTFTGAGDGASYGDAANWDAPPPNSAADDWKISGGALTLQGQGAEYTNRWGGTAGYDLFTAPGAALKISGGARLFVPDIPGDNSYSDFGLAGASAEIIVSGTGTVWRHAGTPIRLDGAGQLLRITGGAALINASRVFPGFSGGAAMESQSNRIEITDGGKLLTLGGGASRIGYAGNSKGNLVRVGGAHAAAGKAVWDMAAGAAPSQKLVLGEGSGADGNMLLITSGGVVTNSEITIGERGAHCGVVVTNGGLLHSYAGGGTFVGLNGSHARAWIGGKDAQTGEKSTWDADIGSFVVGDASSNNMVTVAADGVLLVSKTKGGGLKFSRRDGSHHNTLVIERGGVVRTLTAGITMAESPLSWDNLLLVDGGELRSGGTRAHIARQGTNHTVVVRNGGLFDLGGKDIYIGGDFDQNPGATAKIGAVGGSLIVYGGGVVTNIFRENGRGISLGHCPGYGGNRIAVTNGGALFAHGTSIFIGAWRSANGAVLRGSDGNHAVIEGGAVEVGVDSHVGYASASNTLAFGGDAQLTAADANRTLFIGANSGTNNEFRVYGGALVALGNIEIGGGAAPWRNKFVTGGGGRVETTALTLAPGQTLAGVLTDGAADSPTVVAGVVRIGADCAVEPRVEGEPAGGWRTVLAADMIEGWENLQLTPEAAEEGWLLRADQSSVRLRRIKNAPSIIIR